VKFRTSSYSSNKQKHSQENAKKKIKKSPHSYGQQHTPRNDGLSNESIKKKKVKLKIANFTRHETLS
jgi:hypothetical protein